jgi:hypothetical protein
MAAKQCGPLATIFSALALRKSIGSLKSRLALCYPHEFAIFGNQKKRGAFRF